MTRKICSVCGGNGSVRNPLKQQQNVPRGRLAGDHYPDVSIPDRIKCQNCNGTGWSGTPDE